MQSEEIAPSAAARLTVEPAAAERRDWVVSVTDALLGTVLVGNAGLVVVNVLRRAVTGRSFIWQPEISVLALSFITFVGAAVVYRRHQHPAMEALVRLLPTRLRILQAILVHWIILGSAVAIFVASIPVIQVEWRLPSDILEFPQAWYILPISLGMLLVGAFAALELGLQPRRDAVAVGGMVVGLVAAAILTKPLWLHLVAQSLVGIVFALFALLLLLGVPIAFTLATVAFVYMYGSGSVPINALVTTMEQGVIGNPILLSIPFFIFAGLLMDTGGISKRIVGFLQSAIGHIRGGLQQVLVVGMYIFSGISGSKAADMAAVGISMRRTLAEYGVPPAQTVAVLASAASMGETIPPSIAMLVLGSITTLSIAALFLAGLFPAVVLAVALMIVNYLRALRSGARRPARAPLRTVARSFISAILPLMMPVALILGVVGGFSTPTEISALAVLYGFILSTLLYSDLTVASLGRTILDSAVLSGMVMFLTSAAVAFSWVLTVSGLQDRISFFLVSLPGGSLVFLAAACFVMVAMGGLFEGLPALLIFTPILLPVATRLSINPLHFGIVMVMAMGIGAFAPPIGIGFYVACAIGQGRMEQATRAMLPYFAILLLGLLVVAFVPWITLVVPSLFGYH